MIKIKVTKINKTYKYTCDICDKTNIEQKCNYYKIRINHLDHTQPQYYYCICDRCFKKIEKQISEMEKFKDE